MPVFVYRAADRRGQTIDGVMEAPDARSVVERLQRDSYFPIRVSPHADRRSLLSLGGSGRIRQGDILAFTQQLATLFEATLPLDRARSMLEELAPNGRVKAIVADRLVSVRGGASLSEALAKHHPRPFSRLYINMIRAGERGGVLEVALRRLAEFLEARAAFSEAVITAVAYPAVVFMGGVGAIIFLMTFVIPRFATIFADLGQTVPLPTQILLTVSAIFQSYWWLGVLLALGGLLAWRMWTGSPQGRLQWDQTILGMPVISALAVVGDTMTNQAIGQAVARLSDGVKRGGTLAAGMQEQAPFPVLAIHMVRVGEETGRLEDMLLKVAETFETDVGTDLKRALRLLEPIIIVGMGVLVAFIVVAMMLAIFSINEIPL